MNKQNLWEDTSWRAYIRFARNLSCGVALIITLMLAMAGPTALLVGGGTGIATFLLMMLCKGLSDAAESWYRKFNK